MSKLTVTNTAHTDEIQAVINNHTKEELEDMHYRYDNFKQLLKHHREKVYQKVAEYESLISGETKYKFQSDNQQYSGTILLK